MITATFFDGKSPLLHSVRMDLSAGSIALAGEQLHRTYALSEARMAEPFAHAPGIVDFADGGRCELDDPAAKAQLAAALGFRKSAVMRWQQHWYGALFALVLLLLSLVMFVQFGVPALAETIVARLPASVDQKIGDQAMASLDKQMFTPTRLSSHRVAEIEDIFREVLPEKTRIPVILHVANMEGLAPNALALPNGHIYMTDGMIRTIMGKEPSITPHMKAAIAGILAHEIAHVEGRHSMHALARASLLALGSAALFGDFSAVVAGAPVMLLNMDYSRRMEAQSDTFAIYRLLELRMSPSALADLFDELEAQAPGMSTMPRWMRTHLGYLSSHPATSARSAMFRQAGEELDAEDAAADAAAAPPPAAAKDD